MSRRPIVTREDPGNREEVPRTDEVKNYSQALWQFATRSTTTRIITIVVVGYIFYTFTYVFGLVDLQSQTSAEGQKVCVMTSVAWMCGIVFIGAPIASGIYRPGIHRVSRRIARQSRKRRD